MSTPTFTARRSSFALAFAGALLLALALALASAVDPAPASACTCAPPQPWSMSIAPLEGSVAPRNTRIWVTFSEATMPGGPDVALLDQAGTRVPLTATVLSATLKSQWWFRMLVLAPGEPLAPDARYTVQVRKQDGTLALPAQTFMTSSEIDVAAPAPPTADEVRYTPGDEGSTCGSAGSLLVSLDADTWIVRRAPNEEGREPFDPAAPSGAIDEIFLDEPEADLYSGPCGARGVPAGRMQLGTFDLAGNFSGWGKPVSYGPEPEGCSVRAPGARPGSALAVALFVAALLALRRSRTAAHVTGSASADEPARRPTFCGTSCRDARRNPAAGGAGMGVASAQRGWSVAIGLAVSGAALAGLVLVEGRAAQAEGLGVLRAVGAGRTAPAAAAAVADPIAEPAVRDWSGVRGKIRKQTGASAAQTAVPPDAIEWPASKQSATPGPAPLAAGAVMVPELVGKRLAVARREARKLGLTVVVRDVDNQPVPADESYMYNVRKQSVAAGGSLQRGETLQLRVRKRPSYAMGY